MLFFLVVNWLVRSGRLNKVLLYTKSMNQRRTIKFTKGGLIGALIMASLSAGSNPLSFADSLPVPAGINNQLFYLQRDPDANTVVYKLNIKNGELVDSEPVSAFWQKTEK